MDDTAWIKTVPEDQATEPVKEAYRHSRSTQGLGLNIARASSLWPELLGIQEAESELFRGANTELSEQVKDLIAAHVAQLNNSGYCQGLYRRALTSKGWSDEKITHLLQDIDSNHLGGCDRAVLRYANKITRRPQAMMDDDINTLRESGASDRMILETAAVAGYFNYITRLANALGVSREA